MIFLTVGTQFPFDRLVRAVDDWLDRNSFGEEVCAQIGDSSYVPRNFKAVASLDKAAFDQRFEQASAIISHAGMGTITMALDHGKALLAMPRLKKYREVVNDHQMPLAEKFETLGHILLARDEGQLADKLYQLKSFVPQPRKTAHDAVAQHIGRFLEHVGKNR
jgi:UDP-N-acetylglucosamine transferase subunit ALG13